MGESIRWNKDEGAESLLRSPRLKMAKKIRDYLNIPVNAINIVASRYDNTRHDGFCSQERISNYAMEMANGAVFPSIVVHECDGNTYEIVGGVHRYFASVENKWQMIFALVLTHLTDRELQLARVALNTIHGKDVPPKELVQLAAKYIIRNNISTKGVSAVASAYGVAQATLNSALRAARLGEDCKKNDIDMSKVAVDAMRALCKIEDRNVRLLAAAAVASSGSVSVNTVSSLVDDLQNTHASKANETIDAWKRLFAKTDKGAPKSTHATNVLRYLSIFQNAAERLGSLSTLSEPQLKEFHARWKATSNQVNAMIVMATS